MQEEDKAALLRLFLDDFQIKWNLAGFHKKLLRRERQRRRRAKGRGRARDSQASVGQLHGRRGRVELRSCESSVAHFLCLPFFLYFSFSVWGLVHLIFVILAKTATMNSELQ